VLDHAVVADRIEIADLLTRYTRAIDTRAWDRLDEVFLPEAHIDYTASGGIAGAFPEVKAWLARTLPIFAATQHLLGQSEVTVAGDAATVVAYFTNPMVPAHDTAQLWEFGGYYHHRLVRTPAGWRSAELVEELSWRRGLPA
jgi:hypothetical protein